MKNKENFSVAVRKPDGEIAIEVENYQGLLHDKKWRKKWLRDRYPTSRHDCWSNWLFHHRVSLFSFWKSYRK